MNVPHFIAGRIKFGNLIAFVCIAVSFLVILIAVAVSSGFKNEIRRGVSAISGDVQLAPRSMDLLNGQDPVNSCPSYLGNILSIDGVDSVAAVVYRGALVKTEDSVHGVLFKGMEGISSEDAPLSVHVPRKLSNLLALEEGDKLTAYFIGNKVKVRNFTVSSVYQEVLSANDKLVVYADINDLRRLNGWSENEASALEIALTPEYRSLSRMKAVEDEAGTYSSLMVEEDSNEDALVALSSASRYPQLFAWLQLLDTNVLLVLILMLIVAGFNMISGLLIIIFDNISKIGLLKTMGMNDRDISKVFLDVAARLVLKGMVVGNAIALILCVIQNRWHLISLNPENYFIDFVPLSLGLWQVLFTDILSFAVIMLMLLLPLRMVSRIDPARTIRTN